MPPDPRPPSGNRPEEPGTADPQDALAHLTASIRAELDVCVDGVVRRITLALPSVANAHLPRGELWSSIFQTSELLLALLAQRRSLTDEETHLEQELGKRWAYRGVAVADALRSLQMTCSHLWEALTRAAGGRSRTAQDELISNTSVLWSALEEITAAVADGHQTVTSAQDLDMRRRGLNFLEGLRTLPAGHPAAEDRARRLGLDTAGCFLVAVFEGRHPGPWTARGVVLDQPGRSLLIVQPKNCDHATESSLARWLLRRDVEVAGVGVAQPGLVGAARSLDSAHRAHAAATVLGERILVFRQRWFECLVLETADALDPMLGKARDLLRSDEEMHRTIERYLAADGKLIVAGRALYLHPNSVAYRLRRFAELTGVDPRTSAGIVQIRAALALALARHTGEPN